MRPYYVTTPIYYVNDKPHVGHAYSTVAADVLARYARLRGRPTRFLTGTDEHGQKIEERASSLGKDPQAFVDEMSPPFRAAFEKYDCSFDDYIRTTEPRHKEKVQAFWRILEENGDIYLGEYEGWYSVADEAFITETELKELDEVTRAKVQKVREESYFFKLSEYGDKLLEFYEANPTFVQPEGRFNEVKAFVKGGLRDLSISRTTFGWGVPVPAKTPGEKNHVMYVWLDALANYMTALGGPSEDAPLFKEFWNTPGDRERAQQVHIVGKDILRFHAVYWPAFLMSAGIELPSQIWAHGWLTINGRKMSKRYGNFIPPGPLADAFGADVVRYYFMRELAFGQDGDFSHRNLVARYHGELGNGLGNLLNRMVVSIVANNLEGRVPQIGAPTETLDLELIEKAKVCAALAKERLDDVAPGRALDAIWELVSATNKYVDSTAPWALAKNQEIERLSEVAYNVMESLRWISIMVAPFMPKKADDLRAQLGLGPITPNVGEDRWPSKWGGLIAGTVTAPGDALFPRYDKKTQAELYTSLGLQPDGTAPVDPAVEAAMKEEKRAKKAKAKAAQKSKAKKDNSPAASTETIEFDDFMRVDLRVGLILEAEPLKKSDRLFKLQIDLGEEKPRQILAGIKEHYNAADLVGQRVVVVANLKPRKMMGTVSEGMVLAASDSEHGLTVIGMSKDIQPGTRVS